MKAFPVWHVVEKFRGIGVMPPDARPGGKIIASNAELLPAVKADLDFHGFVKYVVIANGDKRPELRIAVPKNYTGHPYLSGGKAEILAGGQIHIHADHLEFTNETTHFRTGTDQEKILLIVLKRIDVAYRLSFPLESRPPDGFIDVDVE